MCVSHAVVQVVYILFADSYGPWFCVVQAAIQVAGMCGEHAIHGPQIMRLGVVVGHAVVHAVAHAVVRAVVRGVVPFVEHSVSRAMEYCVVRYAVK